jgi:hypothetical protein
VIHNNSINYLDKVEQENLKLIGYCSDNIRSSLIDKNGLIGFTPMPGSVNQDLSGLTSTHREIIREAPEISLVGSVTEWTNTSVILWKSGVININQFKNQWVCGYRDVINTAALKFHIPAKLLAAIAWREVGGAPPIFDIGAIYARQNRLYDGRSADETSLGDLSVQIRTAARALGYDESNLTEKQRKYLIQTLINPKTNIYIAAKYLSDLRSGYLPLKDDYQSISEDEMKALAGAYNFGAVFPTINDFWKPLKNNGGIPAQYGVSAFNGLRNSPCWDDF